MKKTSVIIALSTIALYACGGSDTTNGVTSDNSKQELIAKLSNTSWNKECTPYYKNATENSTISWYVNITIDIDSSLKTTYTTNYFRPTDTVCNATIFDTTDISRLEITNKIMSEESIEAYGLNENFIYHSDKSDALAVYTLIYLDSEKLYFGQASSSNNGDTAETRHSSISLDDYFTQIIN